MLFLIHRTSSLNYQEQKIHSAKAEKLSWVYASGCFNPQNQQSHLIYLNFSEGSNVFAFVFNCKPLIKLNPTLADGKNVAQRR